MRPRLYCEECDQRYDGQGDPRSDHGHCQDCYARLVIYDYGHDRYGNVGRRYEQWRGFPDEDHE